MEGSAINKKEWFVTSISVIGLIIALTALPPEDWAINITSWRVLFYLLAVIGLVFLLSFLISKKLFSDGYIMAFKSRTNIRLRNLLEKELNSTISIVAIGVACDELSKQPYEFWKHFFKERDGKLRIMFEDPDGLQIGLREKMVCREERGEFAESVRYNLRILVGNLDRISNDNNCDAIRAEIKLHDFAPVLNCIITDNYVFFHHYGSSTRGIDMPNYVIRKGRNRTNNQVYEFYRLMLDDLWQESKKLKEENYRVI